MQCLGKKAEKGLRTDSRDQGHGQEKRRLQTGKEQRETLQAHLLAKKTFASLLVQILGSQTHS